MTKRYIAFLLAMLFVLAGVESYAQQAFYIDDTLSMPHRHIPEISVKLPKENREIIKLPASVSLVTAAKINESETRNLKDITARVPNLFMPEYGSRLTSPVYIRGVGSRINAPSVGLYVDGIPFFEKSTFDFDFFDIERIEVLRGPQGTLYGRNTMGGIINVVSHSPLKTNGTQANISGGNYGHLKASLLHSTKIADEFGVSLGGSMLHSNGFFENKFHGKAADPLTSYNGRVKAAWAPSEQVNIQYTSMGEISKQGGYPYGLIDKTTQVLADVNYNYESGYHRNLWANGLTFKYETSKIALQAATSHQYYNDNQFIDQDFTPADLYNVVQKDKQNLVSQEIIVRSNHQQKYQWLLGTYGFWQKIDKTLEIDYGLDFTTQFNRPADFSSLMVYKNNTSGLALFHQSSVSNLLIEGLTLTAGLRVDFENDVQAYFNEVLAAGNTSIVSDTIFPNRQFSKLVPKFSADYSVGYTNVYISVSEGYKTGGYNTTFTNLDELTFDPENSWNYEVGVKSVLADGKISGGISLFYIDWQNQQVYQPVSTGRGSYLSNAGKSFSRGAEAELRFQPMNGLTIETNYGLTDARFTDYQKNAQSNLEGKLIPYIPKHTFFIGSTWYTPLNGWLDAFSLHGNYRLVGKHFWNDENTFHQDAYGILSGKASLQAGILTLELWAKNLTNSNYQAFFFEALGNAYAQKGRPMTAGINLMLKF